MTAHVVDDAGQRAKARTKRSTWLREIWIYTALVTAVVGASVYGLSGEFRLVFPIIGLSLVTGVIGSLLAVLRSLEDNPPANHRDSIYR